MNTSRVAARAGVLAAAVVVVAAGSAVATTPTPAPGSVPGVASTGMPGGAFPALHVFYRSTGGQLIEKTGGSTTNLGGTLTSGPAAVTSSPGEFFDLRVHARGTDGNIWWRQYSDGLGEWLGWRSAGAPPAGTTGAPGATCVGAAGSPTRLYVRGRDGALWRRIGGGAWTSLGGRLTSDPVPIPSAGPGCAATEIVYARGTDNAVHQWTFRGWTRVGGVVTAAPAVLQLSNSEVDVFARGSDGRLYQTRRLPGTTTWTAWTRISVRLLAAAAPTATRHVPRTGPESRRVFWIGSDGKLYGAANAVGSATWSFSEVR